MNVRNKDLFAMAKGILHNALRGQLARGHGEIDADALSLFVFWQRHQLGAGDPGWTESAQCTHPKGFRNGTAVVSH